MCTPGETHVTKRDPSESADLVLEVIVGELQAYDLIMQARQEVVKALELHALLAILTKEVEEKSSIAVPEATKVDLNTSSLYACYRKTLTVDSTTA